MNIRSFVSRSRTSVVTIDISWSLQAAAALMMHHRTAALVVTDPDGAVGVISERDLVGALADAGSRVAGISIRDVITGPVPAMDASESVMHAIALMTQKRLRHLPVFDGGKVIALVTLPELIKYRLREIELEAVSSATWPPAGRSIDEGSFGPNKPLPISLNSDIGHVPATLVA